MIQFRRMRLERRAETAFYLLCAGAALYFIGNGLIPYLLDRDLLVPIPTWIHGPLLMLGAVASVGVFLPAIVLSVWSLLPSSFAAHDSYTMRPLLELADDVPEFVAPNLSDSRRRLVLETARAQLASGEATAIHAAIDSGETSAQIIVVEGPDREHLRDVWSDLSDGASIRSARTLARSYAIELTAPAVEVVWD